LNGEAYHVVDSAVFYPAIMRRFLLCWASALS